MPALFPKKGPPQETVEGGWQVCQQLYNDWKAHLFVFYTTNGYSKKGDNIGGYNRDVLGWVQHSRTTFPGALIQPNSVTGGSQRVLFIKYRLWQGNWWFRVGNEWIGFYPASLFSEAGLRDKADAIFFYGEVADSPAHLGKSRTDMGSGRWANERWPFAGYAHNLRVQDQANGHLVDYDTTTGWENESDPSLYTLETHIKSGTSWGSYLVAGQRIIASVEFHSIRSQISTSSLRLKSANLSGRLQNMESTDGCSAIIQRCSEKSEWSSLWRRQPGMPRFPAPDHLQTTGSALSQSGQ
jgi:hypothetical protein